MEEYEKNDIDIDTSAGNMVFQKVTWCPSAQMGVGFSNVEDEVYYTSGKKIIGYNYASGIITRKFAQGSNKIREIQIIGGYLYALDIKGYFAEYEIPSGEKTCEYIFTGNSIRFTTVNGSVFYFIDENYTIFILKIIDTSTNRKMDVINTYTCFSNQNKYHTQFFHLNAKENLILLSHGSALILHNLQSSRNTLIDFQKPLSCGLFINDDMLALGDYGGKIHLLSNITQRNYTLTSKHWHSHKVKCLLIDTNEDILFSAGHEGVIVLWNLKTESKNYIPRMNSEICSLTISKDSKFLAVFCKDNSIKIISLFQMTVVDSICSIRGDMMTKLNFTFKKCEEMFLFVDKKFGTIQIFNLKKNKILSNFSILNKNFISSTENEEINNRQLVHVEISKEGTYMASIDELTDDSGEELIISYLKFWKVEINSVKGIEKIELLCVAENPHRNEKITMLAEFSNEFVTVSKSFFKIWQIADNESIYSCLFVGSYRDEKVSSVLITDKSTAISIHGGKFIIEWDMIKKAKRRVYSIVDVSDENEKDACFMIAKISSSIIVLSSLKTFIIFSLTQWEVIMREQMSHFDLVKIIPLEEEFLVLMQNTIDRDFMLVYQCNPLPHGDIGVIKKRGLKYIDRMDNGKFFILNNKLEGYITKNVSSHSHLKPRKDIGVDIEIKPTVTVTATQNKNPVESMRYKTGSNTKDIFEQNLQSITLKK